MAQLAVGGHLGELHLRHQARLHPHRVAQARHAGHRRLVDLVLRQPLAQLRALLGREAGADLARERELAVLDDGDEERAEQLRIGRVRACSR